MCLCLFSVLWSLLYTYILNSSRLWCGSIICLFMVKFSSQISAFIEIWVATLKISPLEDSKIFFKKPFSHRRWPQESESSMAQCPNAKSSHRWGCGPLPTDDQLHTTKDTGSSSPQEATANVQPSHQHENHLFQMLADMKERMKERKPNQITIESRRLLIREHPCWVKALRQLNNQLQAQIAALQNNQPST